MISQGGVHFHTPKDEVAVFWIPADTDVPMELKLIPNTWQGVREFVGGYVERIHTGLMPELYCGCPMVMLVDEEAKLKSNVMANLRASAFHPTGIFGDAVLVGEGPTKPKDPDEDWTMDWFSLPQSFTEWEGPGAPIPQQHGQPWEMVVD